MDCKDVATKKGVTKKRDRIIINPTMKDIREKAIISFGRFNPPTKGHQKLVESLLEAAKQYNAEPFVYLSKSHDENKNPLSYEYKFELCREAFGEVITDHDQKTVFQIIEQIKDRYKGIILVVGEDRYAEFTKKMFNVFGDLVEVVSVERDEYDYSATVVRESVAEDDYTTFLWSMPTKLVDRAEEIYEALKKPCSKHRVMGDLYNKVKKVIQKRKM